MEKTPHQKLEHEIESRYLNTTMKLIVFLPANYSPLYSYSLLLLQDGADYFNLGRAAKVLDKNIEEGGMQSTICCGIPYPDKYVRRQWYHPDSEQNRAYINFLIYECLPFMENKYALEQLGPARAIGGDSLGGTVSLMTALKFPHTFGNVIAQSPMVNGTVLDEVKKFEKGEMLTVRHSIGTNETAVETTSGTVEDFLAPNRELREALEAIDLSEYTYRENDGKHTWRSWKPELPDFFKLALPKH